MRKRLLTRWILTDGLLVALLAVLLLLDRDSLIVALGLRATHLLLWIGCAVIGVLLIFVNIRFFLRLRALRPPHHLDAQKKLTPEQIRRELAFFQEEKPKLKEQLQRGTAQLDSMARKMTRLQKIRTRNPQVAFLGQVAQTLEDTQETLCANLVRVLNRTDLWDPQETAQAGKAERYRGHWIYIKQILDRNDEILGVCDDLLLESVHYVNGRKTGADNTAPLESMIEIIQSLSVESGIVAEGKEREE